MTTMTVYQKGGAFRVVSGTHSPISDVTMKGCAVRRYADANEAYSVETLPAIREAIARIAPEVLSLPKTSLHYATNETKEHRLKIQKPAYLRKERELTRKCAHPAGCDLLAERGDIYCAGCRSAIDREENYRG